MTNAIELNNVTRFYAEKRGVQRMNLNVSHGQILGLLGENGSGKTTALKLIVGALLPDEGRVRTLDVDPGEMPPAVRAKIGWLSDSLAVPTRFSLADAMLLQRSYFPTWNQEHAEELARRFEISSASIFGELSLGQKRRFMLTLVLGQMPELLILDEPAGGLDPSVRRQLIEIILEHAMQRPMTIILSSHIMSDVERLVDHVAFIKDGGVIAAGQLEHLRSRVKRLCVDSPDAAERIQEQFHVIYSDSMGGGTRLVVDNFDPQQLSGLSATVEHLNLEELFLSFNAAGQQGDAEVLRERAIV